MRPESRWWKSPRRRRFRGIGWHCSRAYEKCGKFLGSPHTIPIRSDYVFSHRLPSVPVMSNRLISPRLCTEKAVQFASLLVPSCPVASIPFCSFPLISPRLFYVRKKQFSSHPFLSLHVRSHHIPSFPFLSCQFPSRRFPSV